MPMRWLGTIWPSRPSPGNAGASPKTGSILNRAARPTDLSQARLGGGQQSHIVPPAAVLLHRERDGNPGKCVSSGCQVLDKARCCLVYPVVDNSGPVIGKLRAADRVKQGALALLETFGDLAMDNLEVRRRVRNQRGAKLLKQRHRCGAGGEQVQHRIGLHGSASLDAS